MFIYEDLFDIRSNVGAKLDDYIKKNRITKAGLCKESGVSRPTLDKVLNGTIGSKANYERHIQKIFASLNITPDSLFGSTTIKKNNVRTLRSIQRTKLKELAECAGISEERFLKIESGEEPTLAELRDIAVVLNTSTSYLKGENIFEGQVSLLDYFFEKSEEDDETDVSGFWGHLGILPLGEDSYYWYPITGRTRHRILCDLESMTYMVIPCMNNKLLFLNADNIRQIRLLDEACDTPENANWDPGVDRGEVPPVVYEALEDYFDDDHESSDERMSNRFRELIKSYLKDKKWNGNEVFKMNCIIQHYCDGKTFSSTCDYDEDTSLFEAIEEVYCFEEDQLFSNWVGFYNYDFEEIVINLDQITMIELPLEKVERALFRRMK